MFRRPVNPEAEATPLALCCGFQYQTWAVLKDWKLFKVGYEIYGHN